jgi:hypothetical protein
VRETRTLTIGNTPLVACSAAHGAGATVALHARSTAARTASTGERRWAR